MKSILLKCIIIAAFLGIIIVIIASLVVNSNTGNKAFDSITLRQAVVNFEEVATSGKTVRHTYGGSYDDYATLVCNEIEVLQTSINEYVVLLNYVDNLNRKEKDNLVDMHDKYITQVEASVEYLNKYHTFYNATSTATSESAKRQIPGLSADFVQSYNKAFILGSSFYKELINLVSKYGFSGKMLKNYNQIYYGMLNTYADYTTEFVNTRMEIRRTGASEVGLYSTNIAAANFRKLYNNIGAYGASDEIANNTIATFVNNMNAINFDKLITDSSYIPSLNSADAAKANSVKNFLNVTFGINMSIVTVA